MNDHNNLQTYSNFLENIVESLDIPESFYELAEKRYNSVGEWLGRKESKVSEYSPKVFSQGSFCLGTVIKPYYENGEYDIDLVCEVQLSKTQLTQRNLKDLIGKEIKGYAEANRMNIPPNEGKRCWTLNYSENARFHLDILPALPDGESYRLLLESKGYENPWADDGIAITDNTSQTYYVFSEDWPKSNPKGYANWFRDQMKTQADLRRQYLAESKRIKVEDVPDYKIKTPLQRVIQLLKRHRDIVFEHDQDNKPISIIITTIAALAYNNESDIWEALTNILDKMHLYIEKHGSTYCVPNPVNPLENFADKWQTYPQRQQCFFDWMEKVKRDFNNAIQKGNIKLFAESLAPVLGNKLINESLDNYKGMDKTQTAVIDKRPILPVLLNVAHRQRPFWPVYNTKDVKIKGEILINTNWQQFYSNCDPLPKDCNLSFTASTNVEGFFQVYWQIVNTGSDAQRNNGLRGDIVSAPYAGSGGLVHKESTLYTGLHWIECFIVQNRVCVAKSGEFIVNIQ